MSITGHKEPRLDATVELFLSQLRRQTGMPPIDMKVTDSASANLVIQCDGGTKEVQQLGEDESYRLEVTTTGARLSAPTTLGVMRGLQTFLQLVQTTGDGFAVPAISIDDSPRFPWRGLMIDVGPPLYPARRAEAEPRRHGSGKAQRVSLASFGQPGLPCRKQEVSQAHAEWDRMACTTRRAKSAT